MAYCCSVRTLIRTVGVAAGVVLAASAVSFADSGKSPARSAMPQSVDIVNEQVNSRIQILEGSGNPEDLVLDIDRGGGVYGCALDPATQCYVRPAFPGFEIDTMNGTDPVASAIVGQFNLQRFVIYDDFVPSANGAITELCWHGRYSNDNVCGLVSDPMAVPSDQGIWTVTYWDDLFGEPNIVGFPVGGPFSDGDVGVTVGMSLTGLPLGFNNPDQFDTRFTMTHPAVNVSANTCYWIGFDYQPAFASPCFMNMTLSYQNNPGNRRAIQYDIDVSPPQAIMDEDFFSLDAAICIGIVDGMMNAVPLAPSNGVNGCTNNPPPSNDDFTGAIDIPCGGSIQNLDNRQATWDSTWGVPSCRLPALNPFAFTTADVWYTFTATATAARVSLCPTATGQSQTPGGDSILEIYGQTDPMQPFSLANSTLVGCNDNACGAYSETCVTGLVIGRTYYIRLMSNTPVGQGLYTIVVDCPCPTAANALCVDAIDIPHNPGGVGFGAPAGILIDGSSRFGILNTVPGGCDNPVLANTARGVWYSLVGQGAYVRADTVQAPTFGTGYDTRLTVYCSVDDTCNDLGCLDANDDIGGGSLRSELEWCAAQGKTYYIMVHGFGTNVGEFALLVREMRDQSNNTIACCDLQACIDNTPYLLPGKSVAEMENCNDMQGPTSPNGGVNNGGGNYTGMYETITIGTATSGSLRSSNGTRDFDWLMIRNLPADNFWIDWTVTSQPPARWLPWLHTTNFQTGGPLLAFVANFTNTVGQQVVRKTVADASATIDDTGVTSPTIAFQGLNQIGGGTGYPCGDQDLYWFRANYVLRLADCAAVPVPTGTFQDETTQPTYDGSGGLSGTQGEPCGARNKSGCFDAPLDDGNFLLWDLTMGPMVGTTDATAGPGGAQRDVDFYKFDLAERSFVTLEIDCGGPAVLQVSNNFCTAATQIIYGQAATQGRCGGRQLSAVDGIILDAGTYLAIVFNTDAFGGGTIFANWTCAADNASQSRYVANITATPLPDMCSPAGGTVQAREAQESCSVGTIFPVPTCDVGMTLAGNNGCVQSHFDGNPSSRAYAADPITSGSTVRGTLFQTFEPFPRNTIRVDQDYYEFTVLQNSKLTYSGVADGPVRLQVLDVGVGGANCDADVARSVRLMSAIDAASCDAMVVPEQVIHLRPGTYAIVAAPGSVEHGLGLWGTETSAGGDINCNPDHLLTYTITMDLEAAAPTDPEYVAGAAGAGCSAFSSIVGAMGATRIDVQGGLKVLGDNDSVSVAIGFPFEFYGDDYTQVRVSSNGQLILGDAGNDESALARAFPNDAAPNGLISPFWSSWNVNGHTGADFSVWVRTTGGVGNGVFTVEWNVGLDYQTFAQRASFQAVLFEATGDIEFRYGTCSGLVNAFNEDFRFYAIGIEDTTGLLGVNVDSNNRGGSAFPLDTCNTCYRISAQPPFVCCPGNANGDSAVDFNDITTVLANWLSTGVSPNTNGDANCDGDVNFNDITTILANWLNACP